MENFFWTSFGNFSGDSPENLFGNFRRFFLLLWSLVWHLFCNLFSNCFWKIFKNSFGYFLEFIWTIHLEMFPNFFEDFLLFFWNVSVAFGLEFLRQFHVLIVWWIFEKILMLFICLFFRSVFVYNFFWNSWIPLEIHMKTLLEINKFFCNSIVSLKKFGNFIGFFLFFFFNSFGIFCTKLSKNFFGKF